MIKNPPHPFKKTAADQTEKNLPSVPAPSSENIPKTENKPAPSGLTPVSMTVDSQPQGAEIFLNNRFEGITPLKIEHPPGKCRVRLKKEPEYKDFVEDIYLTEGEVFTKTFRLSPLYRLSVTSDPPGAELTVNGTVRGRTPVSLEVPGGTCRLRLSKEGGWSPIEKTVTLNPGLTPLSFTLSKSAARLSIETDPAEAKVQLGDQELGITPLSLSVPLGIHTIKITKPEYRSIEETISISQDIKKTYLLQKTGSGTIRITALPFADVSIDGKSVGQVPPPISRAIVEGRHIIEFISSALNKRHSLEVEIQPGASIEVRMNMETGKSRILNIE